MLSTGACQTLLIDNSSSKAGLEGTPLLQVMWSCIYVLVAIRAASQYRLLLTGSVQINPRGSGIAGGSLHSLVRGSWGHPDVEASP